MVMIMRYLYTSNEHVYDSKTWYRALLMNEPFYHVLMPANVTMFYIDSPQPVVQTSHLPMPRNVSLYNPCSEISRQDRPLVLLRDGFRS
jgi:hypothetical protein